MWKIIIAEKHFAIRNGLKRILSDEKQLEVVAEAVDARDLLYKLRKIEIHLVLLDISLPGQPGLELLASICKKYPAIPVLVMGMGADNEYEQMILQEGAAGYVCKEDIANEMVDAIYTALDMERDLIESEEVVI